ncbi:MAG: LPS assembly lipoprotein LptE [Desulfococcaceae bacterium]
MTKKISVLLAILFFLSACGYRFAGGGKLPFDVQSMYVDIFQNRTSETGAEVMFANDMSYELSRNGYTITDREKADAVLSGEITSVSISTASRRGQITSLERRVTATVNIRITDRNGKDLRNLSGISQSEVFSVTSESSADDYNKRLILQRISRRIAEETYARLSDEF